MFYINPDKIVAAELVETDFGREDSFITLYFDFSPTLLSFLKNISDQGLLFSVGVEDENEDVVSVELRDVGDDLSKNYSWSDVKFLMLEIENKHPMFDKYFIQYGFSFQKS